MGLIKPDVTLFGEMIPSDALFEAEQFAQQCDVVIVVGTSAQVFPAAQLPFTAKRHGAYVIEANIERTDFTGTVTDAFLEGRAGETLPRLVELVRQPG
jgi:NAD-dependent deacetylase